MSEPEAPPCAGGCGDAGDPVWCRLCRRQARLALSELDDLVTWLEQTADGFGSRTPGLRVSGGSVEPPSPAPLIDLVDRVYADLRDIERTWRTIMGYAPIRRSSTGRTAHNRAVVIAFLTRHLDGILRDRRMVQDVKILTRWLRVLQKLAHAEPIRAERPGRCPRCHMVNVLYADADGRITRCRSCPVELTEDQYQAEVLAAHDPALIAESRRRAGTPDG